MEGLANPMDNKLALSRRASLRLMGTGLAAGSTLLSSCSGRVAAAGTSQWTIGGTAAMQNAASYPDPFAVADQACSLTCEQILGPCWAPRAPVRQDISEGEGGIPMRLAFRLMDADTCAPLEGAELEVWHTSPLGHYSADDVEGGNFCTNGDAHAISTYAFRGRGIADAQGRVTFDSCYPGWYGGRAVHVHLLVRMPEHAGEADTANMQSVTQFYFPAELTSQVHESVEGYVERGQPDVVNGRDSVLRMAGETDPFTFAVERMEDGAMLAWKTINISQNESCGRRGFGGRRRRS